MKAEIHKGSTGDWWYWRFRNGSRVTANNEAFPTKSNAVRAAKAVVRAVITLGLGHPPRTLGFDSKENKTTGVTTLTWYM